MNKTTAIVVEGNFIWSSLNCCQNISSVNRLISRKKIFISSLSFSFISHHDQIQAHPLFQNDHYHLHPHTKSPEIFTRQAKPSNPGFTSSALHCYLSPGWLQTGQIRRRANFIQRNLNHFDKMGSMSTRPGIVGCNCCNWRGRYIHCAPDIKAVWRHCQIARACEILRLCDTK